jgi:acetyl-CoA acyltransferase
VSVMEAADAVRTAEDVVIADAVRSPLGRCGPGGSLADVRPAVLLAQVASALLDRTRLEPAAVTSVLIAGGLGFEDVARETCSLIGVAARPRAPLGPGSTQQSIIHTAARAVGTPPAMW